MSLLNSIQGRPHAIRGHSPQACSGSLPLRQVSNCMALSTKLRELIREEKLTYKVPVDQSS